MFVSICVNALRRSIEFTASVRRAAIAAGCVMAFVVVGAQSASAQVQQDFYDTPFASPTGTLEWDAFTATFGPITPDLPVVGVGAGNISLNSVAQPFDGPLVPIVTSTGNIYTGGTLTDFTLDLSGLEASEANTTVVLQVAAIGSFSGFELDGQTPIEFVDRNEALDVLHGGAPFDTRFYWAEWQLGSETDYQISFGNLVTHQSLAGVRIDYFNSAAGESVSAPAVFATAVPEPTSGLMLAGLLIATAIRRRR